MREFIRTLKAAWLGVASTVFCAACYMPVPGEMLSGMFLHPETGCQEIAQQLQLGLVRSAATPADAGLRYAPFSVGTTNGATLSGWFIPAQLNGVMEPRPLGTVLVSHGTDGNIACAIPWGGLAAQNRFHAVLFDYQGFGESSGKPNVATLLDDSEAVLNWVLSDPSPARQRVHLLGVSLGTSPALGLASLRDRPEIQSVMVDGVFDPQQQLENAAASVGGWLPMAAESAQSEFRWLFDMRANLGNIRVPVLMVTAEFDSITPKSGADAMEAMLPGSLTNAWLFRGLNHVQPFFLRTSNYTSLAVTFWRKPSGQPSSSASATDATIRVPELRPY